MSPFPKEGLWETDALDVRVRVAKDYAHLVETSCESLAARQLVELAIKALDQALLQERGFREAARLRTVLEDLADDEEGEK